MPAQTEAERGEQQTPEQNGSQAETGQEPQGKSPVDPAKRRRTIAIVFVVALIVAVVSVVWWIHSGTYESTDDAQVDAHLNPVASRVQGTVSAVHVEDNQVVEAGQPLLDLDTRDIEVSLSQAQANYDQSVAQLRAENPPICLSHKQQTPATSPRSKLKC